MPRTHALILTLTALAGLPLTGALAAPGAAVVPPDSFINQHVDSIPQLTQQVTMDPVVRRRLARHFHTSGPAMVRYIQNNLVLKRVTVARRYQVYCLASDGHEYLINARLPVGTPIFVMRTTGKPVLKLACGNPMMASLPPVQTKTMPSAQLASLPPPPTAKVASSLAPNAPVILTTTNGVEITPISKVSEIPISVFKAASHGSSPLGFLAGLPILYGITHHGGGSNTPPVTPPIVPPVTPPIVPPVTPPIVPPVTPPIVPPVTPPMPSVPEPSSYAAFAVGGIGLAMLLARAKRRSRKAKV